jgi:hypothetical protein
LKLRIGLEIPAHVFRPLPAHLRHAQLSGTLILLGSATPLGRPEAPQPQG